MTFEKRLRNLVLFSLVKQQLSGDLIAAHSSLIGNCTDGRTKFLLVLTDGAIRDNSPKMHLGSLRAVWQWSSLTPGVTRGIALLDSST